MQYRVVVTRGKSMGSRIASKEPVPNFTNASMPRRVGHKERSRKGHGVGVLCDVQPQLSQERHTEHVGGIGVQSMMP